MARGDFPSSKQDQFVLRFPDGLRGRIKAYAQDQGRSMNEEIVRLLLREFPEPETLEERLYDILPMLETLKSVRSNESVEKLIHEINETFVGLQTGRISGLDDEEEERFQHALERYHEDQYENAVASDDLDAEESETFSTTGRTEKIVDPQKSDQRLDDDSPF